jgi:hypothetical protein
MHKLIISFWLMLFWFGNGSAATVHVDDIGDGKAGHGNFNDPYRNLQTAFNAGHNGDTIIIAAGSYPSESYAFHDSLCGNCQEHRTPVLASRGFLIQDKGLIIIGAGCDSTVLTSNAGYGLLYINSYDSEIRNVKITGGIRDIDGSATDGGIVVRWSNLTISGCLISDNTQRPDSIIVGICGIVGREGAELTITDNRLLNNSWDGIALYRGATAYISDNIINGGRGAGIGITWDAVATVARNRVSNYWKGIGSFGDSRVVCSNNVVFDNLGWGIIATGTSFMDATNNVVYHNGNCGMAIWSDNCTGRFSNNIVSANGWRDEWVCPCVGIWNYGKLFNFAISYNDIWSNKAGEYRDMPDYNERDGNINLDPKFKDTDTFQLIPDSPLINKGNPLISDCDGSPSDIGITGGPRAKR